MWRINSTRFPHLLMTSLGAVLLERFQLRNVLWLKLMGRSTQGRIVSLNFITAIFRGRPEAFVFETGRILVMFWRETTVFKILDIHKASNHFRTSKLIRRFILVFGLLADVIVTSQIVHLFLFCLFYDFIGFLNFFLPFFQSEFRWLKSNFFLTHDGRCGRAFITARLQGQGDWPQSFFVDFFWLLRYGMMPRNFQRKCIVLSLVFCAFASLRILECMFLDLRLIASHILILCLDLAIISGALVLNLFWSHFQIVWLHGLPTRSF